MPRPSRRTIVVTLSLVVALGATAGVVAVARVLDPPSPTTAVTTADGDIVVDWADYPADSQLDPADVLTAPRAGDVADVGTETLSALRGAVEQTAPDLDWTTDAAEDAGHGVLFPVSGNGYGGDSLHLSYNSPTVTGVGLDADADWHSVTAAVDAELDALGYTPVLWDFNREPYDWQTTAEQEAEIVDQFGSLDPDEMWSWSGMATNGSMWAWVTVWDTRRGAPEDAWPETQSGISLFVGGTVVAADDERAYADGVAPFEGLTRPEPTHSD